MKKKIAISCNTSWGIFNFRGGLIRRLIQERYEVITIAPYDEYVGKLEGLGARHLPVKMDNKGKNPLRDYALYRQYLKIFRYLKPTCILNYTIKPVVYGGFAAKKLDIPYLSFITGLGTGFLRGSFLRKVVEQLYRGSQDQAKVAYFLNEVDASIFKERKLVPLDKIEILPGEGIDLSHFEYRELPESDQAVKFLYLGRVLGDKGVREFLQAAKIIKNRNAKAEFTVIGDCNVKNSSAISFDELKSMGMGKVFEYHPQTDDVVQVIAEHHCIVLPSYREGLPRTLLEASAMGRVIVATDVEGCRDVVQNGRTGYLCKVKDVGSLKDALEKVIQLDRNRMVQMGKEGRKFVVQNFSETLVLDKIFTKIDS